MHNNKTHNDNDNNDNNIRSPAGPRARFLPRRPLPLGRRKAAVETVLMYTRTTDMYTYSYIQTVQIA